MVRPNFDEWNCVQLKRSIHLCQHSPLFLASPTISRWACGILKEKEKNRGKQSESFDHFMTLCVVKIRHDSSGYFVGKRYSLLPNKWILLNITLPLLEWLAMFLWVRQKSFGIWWFWGLSRYFSYRTVLRKRRILHHLRVFFALAVPFRDRPFGSGGALMIIEVCLIWFVL